MATIQEAFQTALACHQAGRLEEAERIYRQILQAAPDHPGTLHLLGVLARQQGKLQQAIEYTGRAIRLDPDQPSFHNSLGEAYRQLGRHREAAACYQRSLELNPYAADAYCGLGNALAGQGNLEGATACYQQAIALQPDYADPYNNLGNLARIQGKLEEAIAWYQRAIQLYPRFAGAYSNLAAVWADLGHFEEAIACCRQALQWEPGDADAHNNLGNVWKQQGKLRDAIACYQRAIASRPDYALAHNNLGSAWKAWGALDEAIACYQRALELKPDFAETHSNLLGTLQYRSQVSLAELSAAHAEFECRHAAPLRRAWRPHENSRDPRRPLRLGFVSPDLGRHPIGYFLVRALENLDRGECEVVCYSDRIVPDDMTARIQAAATAWRDVVGISDDRLAEQIRADRIDVLFDLVGHTAKNRLLAFARKPAPIQITWIGYEGTTGLSAMDYLLADRYMVPLEAEPYYVERVLRMPHGYLSFDPPPEAPAVGPLPALDSGQVTFASFNNPAKMTPRVIACWAEILRRLPAARLILKYRGLDDPALQDRFRQAMAGQGVAPRRIAFRGWSSYAETLGLYNQVDVALDPFPFSGSATTCDALWMGVPVITYPGETFASRHGLSHLSNVGLTETIVGSPEAYIDLAVSLAGDLPRLAAIRAGLRDRVARSPLCDGKQFARDFMDLLRRAWEAFCEPRGSSGG